MKNPVEIYTDGACRGNPGPGGWGVSLRYNGTRKDMHGGEAQTTNNRMELMAAITGLEALTRPCRVKLYTDSQYVRDGITSWMANWKRRGWKTANKKPVKNGELWQALSGDEEADPMVVQILRLRLARVALGFLVGPYDTAPDRVDEDRESIQAVRVDPVERRLGEQARA